MGSPTWFKFFSSEYLLDAKVDALPLDGQAVLVRLWCLCSRDGFFVDDPKVLARRSGVDFQVFRKHWMRLREFFELNDNGMLNSPRMEAETEAYEGKCQKLRDRAIKAGKASAAKRALQAERRFNSSSTQVGFQVQLNPTETEAEAEKDNSLPPSGSGDGVKAPQKPSWQKAHPAEVIHATQEIRSFWPNPQADQFQPDQKTLVPGVSPSELASRLADIHGQGADLAVCVAIARRAVNEWQNGKWIKAPEHFFGKAKDAPYKAYYQAFMTNQAMKKESVLLGDTA